MLPTTNRPPDFGEFLKMIRREPTSRPVLYEHYIEWPVLLDVLGRDAVPQDDPPWGWVINLVRAYARGGRAPGAGDGRQTGVRPRGGQLAHRRHAAPEHRRAAPRGQDRR
jgi:hypothetical protein